jgi:hypothetical protein
MGAHHNKIRMQFINMIDYTLTNILHYIFVYMVTYINVMISHLGFYTCNEAPKIRFCIFPPLQMPLTVNSRGGPGFKAMKKYEMGAAALGHLQSDR